MALLCQLVELFVQLFELLPELIELGLDPSGPAVFGLAGLGLGFLPLRPCVRLRGHFLLLSTGMSPASLRGRGVACGRVVSNRSGMPFPLSWSRIQARAARARSQRETRSGAP